MKTMFCPNCGAEGQNVESYCRFCGEWLPDINALANPKMFGKLTREQKIGKMRTLEMVSAGLSLTSAAIVISILAGGDIKILFLAAFCSILVFVYQIINFYLGHKIHRRPDQRRSGNVERVEEISGKKIEALNAANTNDFINQSSITENTTKDLEPRVRKSN